MVKFLVGEKGQGKTKKLIELTNEEVKSGEGQIVFIDDDNRHIYDIHHSVRFVDTSDYSLSNYREFIGFIYGVLSQNSDINSIFIDGLNNIIKTIETEDLLKLNKKLLSVSSKFSVDFTIIFSGKIEEFPQELKEYII